MTAIVQGRHISSERRWVSVASRYFLAGLLLVAAILKYLNLFNSPSRFSIGLKVGVIALAVVEITVAFFILANGQWRGSLGLVILALFAFFLGASGSAAFSGQQSCGCFGSIRVDSRLIASLDAVVVAILSALKINQIGKHRPLALICLFFGMVAMPVAGAWALRFEQRTQLQQETLMEAISVGGSPAGMRDSGGAVLLSPRLWVGHPFPLTRYLKATEPIMQGEWHVVLFRHDCEECLKRLPGFKSEAISDTSAGARVRWIFIELPPYGTAAGADSMSESKDWLLRRLPLTRDWIVETPTVCVIVDGTVNSVL